MISLSPTLLQAATAWGGRPVARATLEDRRLRWSPLHTWPADDASPTTMYHNGSYLLRARSDGGGQVWVARVSDPAGQAGWEQWLPAASGARPHSDVALTWRMPATWLMLYEGAGGTALWRTSSDHGTSWSAPAALHTGSAPLWLALWGSWALVLEEGLLHGYRWTGSSWSGPYSRATAAGAAGVAVWYDEGARRLHAWYAAGGQLWQTTANGSLPTPLWSTPRVLAPGGDQPPSEEARTRLPALAWVPALGLVASCLTGTAPEGGAAPLRPMTALAPNPYCNHPGQWVPLAPPTSSAQRWALAWDPLTQTLYCGNRSAMFSAPVPDAAVRSWMRLGPLDALGWRWRLDAEGPGHLSLTLLDREGALMPAGVPGQPAAAARPLASLRLQRGYVTPAGEETVDTADWTVLSARYSIGREGGRLTMEGTDALGLLALWRPSESLVWQERTVHWLLDEVCARVGLAVLRVGAPGLDVTLPAFSLHPHQTALTAVQGLLRLGCAVARPAGAALQVLALPGSAGTLPALGARGEIREGQLGPGLPGATLVRVSSATWGLWADAEASAEEQAAGLRLMRTLEDNRVHTAALAKEVAGHALALARLSTRADSVTVPLRPDLELWDAVRLVAGAVAGPRTVVALEELAQPALNRFETRLGLGAL